MKPTIKKLLVTILALSIASSLLILPASADETISTFPDIDDPEVGTAVEVLRVMGVIGGDNGNYRPEGSLTRAEFCKITILMMGRCEDVGPYETRTIFTDVASSHWARGYVNLAVNTEVDGARLILGTGDGCFHPDDPITYDQAVTILLRMLGYGKQILTSWPSSAEALAISLGLNDGVGSFTGDGPITRAQTAILFKNLLLTTTSSGSSYAGSTLGSAVSGAIILSTSIPAGDGSPAVTLSTSRDTPVKPAAYMPSPFMLGIRGTVILDSEDRFLTFIPDAGSKTVTLTIDSVSENAISGIDRTKITVPKATKVLRDGDEYIFGDVYEGLDRPGLVVTVVYTSAGVIDYIFVRQAGAISGAAVVAQSDGLGAFSSVTNASDNCRIVKNGSTVTKSALKKWDVGVYDQSENTLYVSDFRLTGQFEAASPSAYAPATITILGRAFEVLPSAFPDFENIKVGDLITALFTPGGKIAAVRSQKDVGGNAFGVLRSDSTSEAATVDLINSPLDKDAAYVTSSYTGNLDNYIGQIVSVTGSTRRKDGKTVPVMYISRQASAATGSLDVKARTVGGKALADNAALFERVGSKSLITSIALADINLSTVPESKVVYAHENSDGAVDILVLDDVTGDRYTYGFVKVESKKTQENDFFDLGEVWNDVTTVTYGPGEKDFVSVVGSFETKAEFGGAAVSLSRIGEYNTSAGYATLTAITGVTQANFNASTRTFIHGSVTLPVADAVMCYSNKTNTWFKSLDEALIYSNSFTVYYDRTPTTGGKVRIIVAE